MYSFEEFKNEFILKMDEMLTEKYGQVSIMEQVKAKNNRVLTGICFNLYSEENIDILPIVYAEHLYADYENGEDMEDICQEVISMCQYAIYENEEVKSQVKNILNEKENIVLAMIHTEGNEALLQDVPHREYMDMSIMYRWFISNNGMVNASAVVTNQLAQKMGLDESELYNLAYENTKRIFSPCWFSVTEYLRTNFDIPEQEVESKLNLYGISNDIGTFGAASILYPELLDDLAKKLGSDMYLLPSSIHEFLAVSTDCDTTVEKLQQMVYDVNLTQVDIDERLSNQIYHYDHTTQQITQITNSPYTRLDIMQKTSAFEDVPDESFEESGTYGMIQSM